MAIRRTKRKTPINEILGIIAGAVAAGQVKKIITNFNLPGGPMIGSAAPIVLGFILSGQKSEIIRGLGFGMIAKGGSDLATEFLPGIGNIDDNIEEIFINESNEDFLLNEPADMSILSEPADMSILSGTDDITAEELAMMGMDEDEF
jgi:hypothetical protein